MRTQGAIDAQLPVVAHLLGAMVTGHRAPAQAIRMTRPPGPSLLHARGTGTAAHAWAA